MSIKEKKNPGEKKKKKKALSRLSLYFFFSKFIFIYFYFLKYIKKNKKTFACVARALHLSGLFFLFL